MPFSSSQQHIVSHKQALVKAESKYDIYPKVSARQKDYFMQNILAFQDERNSSVKSSRNHGGGASGGDDNYNMTNSDEMVNIVNSNTRRSNQVAPVTGSINTDAA